MGVDTIRGLKQIVHKLFCINIDVVIQLTKIKLSPTRMVVYGAILSTISTLLQSAGMIGGIGLLISAFSTFPVLLATLLSLQVGLLTFITSSILIGLIQPSELFAFPFTTGLLGLSMGFAILHFKKVYAITLFSGICLTTGIFIILCIIRFPILGPTVPSEIEIKLVFIILLFSTIYSWIWFKLLISFIKRLRIRLNL